MTSPSIRSLPRSTTTQPRLADVRKAAGAVRDPELPAVTLAMLGVLHEVALDGDHATIELLPTFSGCPALDVISEDVRTAVGAVDGVGSVTVRFRHDPPWTPDRITPAGHEALRSFGIAPPVGRSELPVLPTMSAPAAAPPRPCPYCHSTDTERDGMFGPTPCRDVRYCRNCQQPFEAFKS